MHGDRTVEGLVLCRVGEHRVAVLPDDVSAIEEAHGQAPYAGRSFSKKGRAPAGARLLRDERGGVLVDALEVCSERLTLFAVPAALSPIMGGALAGFAEAAGALWPVVSFRPFARYLEAP